MQSGEAGNLGEALRTQTRPLHVHVERSAFMQDLLRGRIDRAAYCALLRNLHVIYVALEDALARHADHPGIAPIWFPELGRGDALADDLSILHGVDWPSTVAILPAAADYADRIDRISADEPALLAAHAYVRYLGDLSGGQMLRRIVARTLCLDGERGTTFYAFGNAEAVATLAGRFRRGLDTLDVDGQLAGRLVAEAKRGFRMHARLFEQMAAAGTGTAPG